MLENRIDISVCASKWRQELQEAAAAASAATIQNGPTGPDWDHKISSAI